MQLCSNPTSGQVLLAMHCPPAPQETSPEVQSVEYSMGQVQAKTKTRGS